MSTCDELRANYYEAAMDIAALDMDISNSEDNISSTTVSVVANDTLPNFPSPPFTIAICDSRRAELDAMQGQDGMKIALCKGLYSSLSTSLSALDGQTSARAARISQKESFALQYDDGQCTPPLS